MTESPIRKNRLPVSWPDLAEGRKTTGWTATASTGFRERSRPERFADIRSAAAAVGKKIFDDGTAREVADLAGVGEAALFRYFRTKREVLLLVFSDGMDFVLARMESADAAAATSGGADSTDGSSMLNAYAPRMKQGRRLPQRLGEYRDLCVKLRNRQRAVRVNHGDQTFSLVTSNLSQSADVLTRAVDAGRVSHDCNGTYLHKIEPTPVCGFDVETIKGKPL